MRGVGAVIRETRPPGRRLGGVEGEWRMKGRWGEVKVVEGRV